MTVKIWMQKDGVESLVKEIENQSSPIPREGDWVTIEGRYCKVQYTSFDFDTDVIKISIQEYMEGGYKK